MRIGERSTGNVTRAWREHQKNYFRAFCIADAVVFASGGQCCFVVSKECSVKTFIKRIGVR